ncbi:hypothetical protein MO973_38550 [Paenibacillus sp. TRM 82003]|nr:hypothetical protein [Paenibacillus sp. TRM 82003]
MRTRTRTKAAAALAALAVLAAPAAAQAAVYPGPNGPQWVGGAIEQEWLRLGGAPGEPLNSETPTPLRTGAYNDFTRQAIYWSPGTGAHTVGGAFYGYWGAQGWENGPLGFPASNETGLRGGVMQQYEGGTLYYSPTTGAHQVRGRFYTLWDSLRWEQGPLGYPASEPAPAAAGGTFQRFQHGAIYQQASSDEPYAISGAFYPHWAAQGYERGRLGYPTTSEVYYPGVVVQYFTGGTLYWTPCTGVTVDTYEYCG